MSAAKPVRRRALVREVNPHLICVLCSGYFIEATTIVECLHTFCRSCLVKYLENSKFCPICDVQLHKNNPLLSVRCDPTLQQLVYKLIPGLYSNEMARRRKYYSELGGPTSDPDCGVFPIGDQYFSPDDSISLSLEFINGAKEEESNSDTEEMTQEKQGGMNNVHHRRYLQCPAAVTMSHLKKFLRMKYCLSHDHKVDIIYGGEVLTDDFSLMDVAYTFSWNKTTPMRFKFRLLQRYTVPVPEPPPVKDEGVKEPTLPPTVPTEPEPSPPPPSPPPPPKELPAKVQLKTLTVQVQKLSNKVSEPALHKIETKQHKNLNESTVANNNNNNINNNHNNNNHNINNNNNNNSNSNNSPPKVKPLARHKPGPKSKTEKQKVELKPVVKTSPERVNVNLKRNHHVEDTSKEINETSKQKDDRHYEPDKKKSKLLGNDTHKNLDNPPQIEPFKINKNEKIHEEKVEEKKKKKVEEKKQIIEEEKKDYDEEMYEIGKWHMDDKSKREEKKLEQEKKQIEENKQNEELRVLERNGIKEEKLKQENKLNEDKKMEEKKNSEEKKINVDKRNVEEKKHEETKSNEEIVQNEKKKFFKEKSYIEKMQEEEDDEDRLRILTPPVEEMIVEEKVPEPAPPPPVAEVQPIMRSEERRKEKKKNKKAKHHHHHRHHDRKRDSPPAATILHSSENDIMKLKIKLTEVNSKSPKYSVVDGSSEERKEPKENGHNHKSSDKYIEKEKYKEKEKSAEKNKIKDDEPQLIAEIINNKNDYSHNSRLETICREKLQQIRPTRPKIPIKQTITKQSVKQDIANVKPIMQSPPIKIQSPPPRQSPSPKSIPPKSAATPKPTISQQQQSSQHQHPQTTTKLNGTIEPLKMPPSTTITVSKITAEEKRQMEQQKLLMNRNNNNGLDSKRPSLEIMLVNAPKKPESLIQSVQQMNNDTKPVEVMKKVMRPTPPSIPLSRLGKNVNFGAKGSPPPLVLAAAKSCHDDSGALDLSGKSSRKSPDIDTLSMRNLVTLSDAAVQIRNGIHPMDNATSTSNISQLKIPMPSLTKPVYHSPQQQHHQSQHHQRLIKPGQNQTVRQIPNPSALMYRQQTINGRSLIPPPALPLSSLRKMESMTKNLEKVTAGLPVKAVEAAGYATK